MSDYIEVDGLRVGPCMWRNAKDELTRLKSEVERLRGRLAELEDVVENYEALKRMHRLDNYPNELAAKAWLLRKQAEAVEPAIRTALRNLGNADLTEEDIDQFAYDYAQRLRQQADEAEKAGGE